MRQFLTEQQLEALLLIYSQREFPEKTREAVRLRIINGHTYELAEVITGVSRRSIFKGVKKLEKAHELMRQVYGGNDD